MSYRYLDGPAILTDGSVLRFPMIGVPYSTHRGRQQAMLDRARWRELGSDMPALNWSYSMRLYKRRRVCGICGHRHGPTRNRPAKECRAIKPDGMPCGCDLMTDWPHPAREQER